MRITNKDGYMSDTARIGDKVDPYTQGARIGDKVDPYTQGAKIGDKVDPYTQGARQNTASTLVDETSASPKAHAKSHGHKKTPMTMEK